MKIAREVTTEGLNLYADEQYPTGKITHIASVEMTIERAMDLHDGESATRFLRQVLKAGTTGFQRLTFVVDPDKRSKAEDALIEQAIVAARKRAQIVAAPEGMRVGQVLSISLVGEPEVHPMVHMPRFMAASPSSKEHRAVPIHAGQGSLLSKTVFATFSLEPAPAQ